MFVMDKMIQEVFLNHKGGRYIYKTHQEKIDHLCPDNGFVSLKRYLEFVGKHCPHQYFNNGPRSSCLKFRLVDDILEVGGHEMSSLARYGLDVNKDLFGDAHSCVQNFLLEHDKTTIAMEIPIWLLPQEVSGYKKMFKSDDVLTGHIDLLRVENGNIWVWDYKPNAQKEKYAATQIFFYALMLSKRTDIPLDKFCCGYFDKEFTFVFKPQYDFLHKLNNQTLLVS